MARRDDDQPRWPAGTPVGPGGRGPGGGRFRGDGPPMPGGGDWADRASSRMRGGAPPPGDSGGGITGGDDYDERLIAWEGRATDHLRSEGMTDEEIDEFWEWVALNGGAGPDEDGDPVEWVTGILPDFYAEREDDDDDY